MLRSKQIESLKQEHERAQQEHERAQQEQVIRELADEVNRTADALTTKCSLVRHISHEIRTPLNVVGVGVDLLIKDLAPHAATLPDGMMDIVYGIQEASTASLEVINELLMFEKLAAGMTTLECVPTPILPFLEQAMKQQLLPARSKEITFELLPPPTVTSQVAINVDPLKLATVFRNLFSNAIKFTKMYGRVTIGVDVKTIKDIDVIEVSVQDSGAGLSAENLSRLFGEGVQFNANGLQGGGGSGLGLFITKGIVELHKHGNIWAESEGEGFGCTFFVHLPLHSMHYTAPTGYSKRGSLELPISSPGSISNIGIVSSRSNENWYESITATSTSGDNLLETGKTMDKNSSSMSTRSERLSYESTTSTNDIGLSAHGNTTKDKQLSIASEVSEHESTDGGDTKHSKGLRSNTLSTLMQPTTVAANTWKPTVLVVDDSKMNRKMLVRMLISKGFACREAEDGMEGLSEMSRLAVPSSVSLHKSFNMFSGMLAHQHTPQALTEVTTKPKANSYSYLKQIEQHLIEKQPQNFAIDAVLIDFNMPRMNGPDAIVEMRKMGFRGPIIGVSGGEEEIMTQLLQAGADDVLQKPVKTDQLVGMLLRGFEQLVPISESDTTQQEHHALLRQFMETLALKAKRQPSSSSPSTLIPSFP